MPRWCGTPQSILVSTTDQRRFDFGPIKQGTVPEGFRVWNQTSLSTCTSIAFFFGAELLWDGGSPQKIDQDYVRDRMFEGMEKYRAYLASPDVSEKAKVSHLLHANQLVRAFKTRDAPGAPLQPMWEVQKEVRGISLLPYEKFPTSEQLQFFNPANDNPSPDNEGRIMTLRGALAYVDDLSIEQKRPLFATIAMNGHTIGMAVYFATPTLSYYYAYDSTPGRFMMTVSITDLVERLVGWLGAYRTADIPTETSGGINDSLRGQFDVIILGLFQNDSKRSEIILTSKVGAPIAFETVAVPAPAEIPAVELAPTTPMAVDPPAAAVAAPIVKKERSASSSRHRSTSSKSNKSTTSAVPPLTDSAQTTIPK